MSQEEGRPARPRSPTSEFQDFQPPAPALRADLPPEAELWRLPDVLLAHLCSFLTTRAVYRLAATCSAFSRLCFPSTVSLCRRDELLQLDEQPQQVDCCGRVLSTLMRRGAGRLKELRVKDPQLIGPLLRALRQCEPAVQLGLLTSLYVTANILQSVETPHVAQPSISEGGVVVLGDVLVQLPLLRALHLEIITDASQLSSVWHALREGACPQLDVLSMQQCCPAVLLGLASALPSRPEGCAKLRGLLLDISDEQPCEGLEDACSAVAACLVPDCLEELGVCGWNCPAEWFNAVVSRLSSCEWPALRVLSIYASGVANGERESDALLLALSRGVWPSLVYLQVVCLRSSDDAWRALSEAMATGPCLRRLTVLSLQHVFQSPAQMELFASSISAGHGYPNLAVLTLSPYHDPSVLAADEADWSPLANALRHPSGLPRLRSLRLSTLRQSRIGPLMEALEHRPYAVKPLEQVHLIVTGGIVDLALPSSFTRSMAEGGAMSSINMLQMLPLLDDGGGAAATWVRGLIEAVEAGGGKQLRTIQWSFRESPEVPAAITNRILRALVHGQACPRLQHLFLESLVRSQIAAAPGGGLDMTLLQALLTGGAACSATLRGVTILPCGLGAADLTVLEACLRDPRVVQLDILELLVIGDDALPALVAVLEVLSHGRAGVRLKRLRLEVQGWVETQAMEVVQRLVEIIDAGGLPTFASLFSTTGKFNGPSVLMSYGRKVGEAELRQAVQRRAGSVWSASW